MAATRWARALPALAGAIVLGLGVAAWPFTVDDAFVLARYARNLAHGAGYAMNAGSPTDGVTGPLALVPGVLGERLSGDPVVVAKVLGLLAMAAAVALVTRRALRDGPARAAVTIALATSGSTVAAWAVGGLETGLATLAFTVAALVAADDGARAAEDGARTADGSPATPPRGDLRPMAAGAAVGLCVAMLAWLRPELALASAVVLAATLRRGPRALAIALVLAGAGAASILAFRLLVFGTPLPLSAQAKPPDLVNGLEYVGRALLVALGGGGVIALVLGAREGGRAERVLALAVAIHLAALVLAGGDWMPGFRLLAPLLPIYALAASLPIAQRLRAPSRRGWGVALLALCLAIPTLDLVLQLPRIRHAGHARETRGAELAAWLREHAHRVAMVDVGYAAYASGVEVVDLGGITDPSIGALPGGHLDKRIDPGALRARDPDTIVLHASVPPRVDGGTLRTLAGYEVERRVAQMPWVRAEMRVVHRLEYAPGYHYVILQRPR